jgi:type IV secretory pathway VirB9-like protein
MRFYKTFLHKRRLILSIIIIIISNAALNAVAKETECREILFKEDRVYEIKAAMYKGTHITLPERLIFAPQVGNNELWTVEGTGHHIMIQPNNAEPQGAKTSLTLVTDSNTSYHFTLYRVPFDQAETCVIIKKSHKFFDSTISGKTEYKTPCESQLMELHQILSQTEQRYQTEIRDFKAKLKEEKKLKGDRINDVISKYRSMIYTRYEWSDGRGFKGKKLITDVWDDGRFTFLRVVPDNRGTLAVKAQIDGQEEMIEYSNDSENIYKITGIYPSFTLVYGEKNKVVVTRIDDRSHGVY